MMAALRNWVGSSLSRKLFVALGATVTAISLAFLALFVGYYRGRLLSERATTSAEINDMLQVALENAMLKRDIEGLQGIVARLGERKTVKGVMILNPQGEVRFASSSSQLGRRLDLAAEGFCLGCDVKAGGAKSAIFVSDPQTGSVLRSVNAVANRQACTSCHGQVADKPVNGILVVDYDAGEIKREALTMGLVLTGSGILVLLAGTAAIGWVMQRSVIDPVHKLQAASVALAQGRFDADLATSGTDELAALAETFRNSSRRIQEQQAELAKREQFLQSLIDAMPDGIRVISPDFVVLKTNKAFCQQMGIGAASVLGHTCYATSHGLSEACAPTLVTCPLHEIAKSGKPIMCRHTHKRGDGSELLVEVSAAPLEIIIDGKVRMGIVEAIRDLSSDIQHSHEHRLSEIGNLAAGVAHEIRNPLSSIHLTLQAMRNRPVADVQRDFARHLNVMDGEIDRCIQVTERLLKLSSPPSDLPELVAVEQVIPEVISLLNAEAERSGTKITLDLAPSLRVVASDSDIRMLVLNIVQNAFHAMPGGGTLAIRGRVHDDDVVIDFQDSGSGITPEDLPRIFQPFWSRRADGAHGTGLGLPICREIVRRHRGNITVTSTFGEGATFTVSLPWAEAKIEAL